MAQPASSSGRGPILDDSCLHGRAGRRAEASGGSLGDLDCGGVDESPIVIYIHSLVAALNVSHCETLKILQLHVHSPDTRHIRLAANQRDPRRNIIGML
jgi:hypothetical protein